MRRAPTYMKGQRAPRRGPSDKNPQMSAMMTNRAVVTSGTLMGY